MQINLLDPVHSWQIAASLRGLLQGLCHSPEARRGGPVSKLFDQLRYQHNGSLPLR
jgi:hypothetical protein